MKPIFDLNTINLKLDAVQEQKLRKIESAICLHRWTQPCIQLDTGNTHLCCRTQGQQPEAAEIQAKKSEIILNSEFNKIRRSEMLNGIRHSDCKQCWDIEEKGFNSPRQGINGFVRYFKHYAGIKEETLISKLIDNDPELIESHMPFMLEISLGNLCNLSCIYCNEDFSSKWESEKINAGELPATFQRKILNSEKELKLDSFWQWIEKEGARALKCICFIGGETILHPELFTTLDKFYEVFQSEHIHSQRRDKIVIQIVTNLNIPDKTFNQFLNQTEKLTPYFRFEILASMESIYGKAEYIRYGLSWELFDKNVNKLLSFISEKKDYQFGFITTVNLLSLSSTKQFLEYAYALYQKYNHAIYLGKNLIVNPRYFSVYNLDASSVSYVEDAIQFLKSIPEIEQVKFNKDKTWTGYIDFLNEIKNGLSEKCEIDQIEQQNFVEWIIKHDARRGSDFFATFPEYKDYYLNCSKNMSNEIKRKLS